MSSNRNLWLARALTLFSLAAIGFVQWRQSASLRNDAFVDEATYIVSGQQLRDAAMNHVPPPAIGTYLSGAPHLYPQLAAAIFEQGGLEGVRVLSLVCMLIATVAVFATAGQLFERHIAGISAAALFSLQAPVLFLDRFATYDAMCVGLLAVALACAVDRTERGRWGTAIVAGVCIGAAAVTKYATLLYLPCIVLVAGLVVTGSDRWKRGGLVAVSAVAMCAALVMIGRPSELLQGFMTTTFSRSVTSGGRAADILAFAATLGGAAAIFALPALVLAPRSVRWAVIVICAFALLAPLNHIRLHEFVSLHKHMAFALVLLCALAGGAVAALIAWIAYWWERGQQLVAVAVAGAAIVIGMRVVVRPGIDEARRLFGYWPENTRQSYLAIGPVAVKSARFLSEEPDLGALYLGRRAPVPQWVHPYYFDYAGQQARGPTDVEPYRRAIRDGYFTAVLLRFGPQRNWAASVEEELLHSQPLYRLTTPMPFELVDGPGTYRLWVRTDAPGAEQVR